jgi:hypothetical protein
MDVENKVCGLPVPDPRLRPLDANAQENRVRAAWTVIITVVLSGTLQMIIASSAAKNTYIHTVAAVMIWVVIVGLVAGLAKYAATRYVSAIRQVAQLITTTTTYLHAMAHKIHQLLLVVVDSQITTNKLSCLGSERGGTGPAPPRDLVGGMPPEPVVVGYIERRGEHYAGLVAAAGAAAIST